MKTTAEIKKIRDKMTKEMKNREATKNEQTVISVGMATCGIASGARPVYDAFVEEIKKNNLKNVIVSQTGCVGMCRLEPMADVYIPSKGKVTYVKLTKDNVKDIVSQHLIGGKPVGALLNKENEKEQENLTQSAFLSKQLRFALRNCGIIDPESIDEYIGREGYLALEKCITSLSGEQIIDIVKKSGLRGRGGAGFSTGMKWEFAIKAPGEIKYVACNADEGDPGAFMDRSVLEGDPHALLEAMTIAGFAIKAQKGFIYIRAEYPLAVKRLYKAIEQSKEYGFLGNNILGTGFSFDIEIRLGAGAFVCGEETALIASIEGQRGEPRTRPPFPAVKGIFGKPTLLNNVETYANINQIILRGAEWFSAVGTEKSKGTKVFALGGKITNTGLVEIPMGTTLREIIYDIGGGCPGGKKFKAAQTGGPSGGCIPAKLVDTKIDYDNLTAIGSMMGSGGLIVMDEDNCMVDIAKYFLEFTVDESCGKCVPCRIGNKRLYEMLCKVTEGKATMEDLEKMKELCIYIKDNSLCGLGQTAPNPVLSTMNYFMDEYEAHVKDKKCPAKVCKGLIRYNINDKCKGCTLCLRNCPVNAISGKVKDMHVIDQEKCIKCGLCMSACKFSAIVKG